MSEESKSSNTCNWKKVENYRRFVNEICQENAEFEKIGAIVRISLGVDGKEDDEQCEMKNVK